MEKFLSILYRKLSQERKRPIGTGVKGAESAKTGKRTEAKTSGASMRKGLQREFAKQRASLRGARGHASAQPARDASNSCKTDGNRAREPTERASVQTPNPLKKCQIPRGR